MEEIAVTGSNGMTGSHMVELLKHKGFSCKEITRNEWNLEDWKSFEELDSIFVHQREFFIWRKAA